MKLVTLYETPTAKLGACGPIFLSLYRGTSSVQLLEELDRGQAMLLRGFAKISTLSVISDAGLLLKTDDAVRQRSVELGLKYEKQVLASAIVVTAKGLSAVMARTFLTGFFLVSRSSTPTRTFAKLEEGVSWLRGLDGQEPSLHQHLDPAALERFFA